MSRRHLEEALVAGQRIQQNGKTRQAKLVKTASLLGFQEDEGIYALNLVESGDLLLVGTGAEGIKGMPGKFQEGDDALVVTHTVTIKQNQPLGGLPVTCIRDIPRFNHTALAAATSGYIYKFDWTQQEIGFQVVVTEKGNQIAGMDVSSEGKTLATVGSNCGVKIYDILTFDMIREYPPVQAMEPDCPAGHVMRLYACKHDASDPNILLTAGWDNVVKVWDLRRASKDPVKHLSGPHICCSDGLDVKFRKVLTASYLPTEALQVWDLRENKVIESFPEDHLYCAKFAPSDSILCSSSVRKTFTCWKENSENLAGNVDRKHGEISIDSPAYSLSVLANRSVLGCYNGEIISFETN